MASTDVGSMGHFVRRVVNDDAIENGGGSGFFAFRFVVLFSFALNLRLLKWMASGTVSFRFCKVDLENLICISSK